MVAWVPSTSKSTAVANIVAADRPFSNVSVFAPNSAAKEAGQLRYLNGVRQLILPVAGAEVQLPEKLHDLGMQIGDFRLIGRVLGLLAHDLLDLFLRALEHLLDARRMDPPICHQVVHRPSSDLPPDGIER